MYLSHTKSLNVAAEIKTFFQSSTHFGKPMWILPSRSCWQEWHLVWSSPAIGQAQCDVGSGKLLYTLDVKHRYLIYYWQLNEVWPLSFGLSHQQGIFISSLFFGHSLSALKMSVWINPTSDLSPMPPSKSPKSSVFLCLVWTSAEHLHHVHRPKRIEMLTRDQLIRYFH